MELEPRTSGWHGDLLLTRVRVDTDGAGRPPAKGTAEAALFPGLLTGPADVHVDKVRARPLATRTLDPSPSLAPDPAGVPLITKVRETGFYKTPLDDILRFRGARPLFFGGVTTDQCVAGTMMDAARLGFDTVLVTDLTATTSPKYAYDAALYNSQWTAQAADLLEALAGGGAGVVEGASVA